MTQIIGHIGGISKQTTRKFLSDSKELEDDECPQITEANVAQYNALLRPIKAMDSTLILKLCKRKTYILYLIQLPLSTT